MQRETDLLKSLVTCNVSFLRKHAKRLVQLRDPALVRLVQLAAAGQGLLELITPALQTNPHDLTSELLAVAIYNQHIPVARAILESLEVSPVTLSFTPLFSTANHPIVHDPNTSLVLGGLLLNTSATPQTFSVTRQLQDVPLSLDITLPRRSLYTMVFSLGSLRLTYTNDTLQTQTSTHTLPLHSTIPLRVVFTQTHTSFNEVRLVNPPNTAAVSLTITLYPFGVLRLSTNLTPPSLPNAFTTAPTQTTPLVSFAYPPDLIPLLPPPLPSLLAVLLLSLHTRPNKQLAALFFTYFHGTYLFQQATALSNFSVRLCAYLGDVLVFEHLVRHALFVDDGILNALVIAQPSLAHRKILLLLDPEDAPHEAFGAIDDVMCFNTALTFVPASLHIYDLRHILAVALATASFTPLRMLCSRQIVGIDTVQASELLAALLLSTPPAQDFVFPLLPTPFSYFTANVLPFTNPTLLQQVLLRGAKPGVLSPTNLPADDVLVAFDPGCVNRVANGQRPLHAAVLRDDPLFVTWLLQHGAIPTLPNIEGNVPLAYADPDSTVARILGAHPFRTTLPEPDEVLFGGTSPCFVVAGTPCVVTRVNDQTQVTVIGGDCFHLAGHYDRVVPISGTSALSFLSPGSLTIVNMATHDKRVIRVQNALLWDAPLVVFPHELVVALPALLARDETVLFRATLTDPNRLTTPREIPARIDYLMGYRGGLVALSLLEVAPTKPLSWVVRSLDKELLVRVLFKDVLSEVVVSVHHDASNWVAPVVRSVSADNWCLYFFLDDPCAEAPHFALNLLRKTLFPLPQPLQAVLGETYVHQTRMYTMNASSVLVRQSGGLLFTFQQHLLFLFLHSNTTDFAVRTPTRLFRCHRFMLQLRSPICREHLGQLGELAVDAPDAEVLAFLHYVYTGDPSYPEDEACVPDRTCDFERFSRRLARLFHTDVGDPLDSSVSRLLDDFARVDTHDVTIHKKTGDVHVNACWLSFLFPALRVEPEMRGVPYDVDRLLSSIYQLGDEDVWDRYLWRRLVGDQSLGAGPSGAKLEVASAK